MIYRLLTEFDQLDNDVWDNDKCDDIEYDEPGVLSDKSSNIVFIFGHTEAIPALYAYLWYDKVITPGEKEALNSLYIEYNDCGRKKFFKWGRLNNMISAQELSASKQAVKDWLVPSLIKLGRKENIDLILYGFAHIHRVKEGSFAEALQKYGFRFSEYDFTCTDDAIYNEEGFGFFLLPSYQLEMIIPRDGENKAFLSNGPLYNNNITPFYQRAVKQSNGADFVKTVRSRFYGMRDAWNKWITQ